ncbi:MAG: TetR/AcrR family transcriptional regulator [Acutalibacteraceae bacterium]|nr:TetR/AcrR family transcriptional regulator [Acutalibacteraceae bacterium]
MKNDTTKQALANALKQLLQKKQITKITINDIAEACGISRMTFYYHFKDIYDLADWTLQETLHTAIADNRTHDNWQQGFLNLLDVLKAHQPLILNVYRAIDREQVERYMRREVEALLLPVVEEQAAGLQISEKGKHMVAIFYTYAFMGIVLEWIQRNMQASPQEVADTTAAMIHSGFRNSLENMSRYESKKAK